MTLRMSLSKFSLVALTACCWVGCGSSSSSVAADAGPVDATVSPSDADTRDILVRLNALPGTTATELVTMVSGYRAFDVQFVQPVDHSQPTGPTFIQHATLMHRDTKAPMLYVTSGYYDYIGARRAELTRLVAGNQLSIEHRFFGDSIPSPADWTKLTIVNAAADEHTIIERLRTIYSGPAATTGASKGGMTSSYHRRFYPDDVVAAFPYVAPLSFSDKDTRYLEFLDTVGTASCRKAVRDLQVEMLKNRRAALETRANAEASNMGVQFSRVAVGPAVEVAVVSLDFVFWQYSGITQCNAVPATNATDDQIYDFLSQISPVLDSTDEFLAPFEAYYYQAAFELGAPSDDEPHLAALLRYADSDFLGYLPVGAAVPTYRPQVMQDIDTWVQGTSDRMLFVYGQWDPWTAAAYRINSSSDSLLLTVAQGTHGSNIGDLAPADRALAASRIEQWLGVVPKFPSPLLRDGSEPRIVPPRFPTVPHALYRIAKAVRKAD
jgi:hypothetical protein